MTDGIEQAQPDRAQQIVADVAPDLAPKTWYGFPTYAKDGKVVVFYQPAAKFKTRYGTVGFQDAAQLDDGAMWAVTYAVVEVTDAVRAKLRDLVATTAGAPEERA